MLKELLISDIDYFNEIEEKFSDIYNIIHWKPYVFSQKLEISKLSENRLSESITLKGYNIQSIKTCFKSIYTNLKKNWWEVIKHHVHKNTNFYKYIYLKCWKL